MRPAPQKREHPARKNLALCVQLLVMAFVFSALVGTSGCGAAGTSRASDPAADSSSQQGILSPSSSNVSFGNVAVGGSTAQLVTLTDTGRANVTISSVSASGNGFSVSGGSEVILTPNQSVTVSVNFNPTTAGSAQGGVSVVSSASPTPLVIGLAGSGTAQTHAVTLNWQPSTSQVVGYVVYRAIATQGASLTQVSNVNASTSFTDSSVTSGQTYLYAVASVDAGNVESAQSAPISVSIP